jgi:hypothetical protein
MPRRNIQSCVGYQKCFGTRDIVLCKSQDVKRVEDAGSMLNTGENEDGGDGRKRRYFYSSSCDLIHILRFVG